MTEEPIPEGEFPCVVGLRPEQVYIHTEAVESSIPATIYAGQPAGSETLVTLTVGGQEFLAKEIGLKDYEMGQTVYLEIDPNKLNVYDEKSTRLIKLAV